MITYDYYYYNYDDDADDDDHRDDVDMVERHLMETCNRVCTNSVQRYKPAKQISTQTLFAFAFAGILGLYWLNLYCTKQSTNQETSGELSWAPLRLRLDHALCKEHVFKGARKKNILIDRQLRRKPQTTCISPNKTFRELTWTRSYHGQIFHKTRCNS